MDGWSGKDIENIIAKNCRDFRDYYANFKQLTDNLLVETITYMRGLRDNPSELIPTVSSVERAPRQSRKKRVTRIETIVEDDSELESVSASATRRLAREEVDGEEEEEEEEKQRDAPPTRSRRMASLRAANNIKKQQTSALNVKLRRPSESEDATPAAKEKDAKPRKQTDTSLQKREEEEEEQEKDRRQLVPRIVLTRERSSKRPKASSNGFDEEEEEEEGRRPSKRSRRERKQRQSGGRKASEDVVVSESRSPATKRKLEEERASSRGGASAAKKANRAAAGEMPKASDASFDLSLNDATLGRPTPISSSTLKCANSTVVLGRNADLTYCLEKDATMTPATASAAVANATMTIATAGGAADANATIVLESQLRQLRMNQTVVLEKRSPARPSDSLITEDDSSPERKTVRKPRSAKKKQQQQAARNAAAKRRASSSEEDVPVTPSVARQQQQPPRFLKDGKNAAYKPSALFSPYAKDSVRKRVQAFEQVGMNSPKSAEVEAPMRLTRTKTRALAAAEAGANVAAQKAARKSLAKAKKISLARQLRDDGGEETKENQELGPAQRFNRAVAANEKLLAKQQQQQRITPVGKSRILMPASSSRIPRTPAMSQLFPNNLKAMSATRPNIVTHVESFLPLVRPLRKSNSADKMEEKKRRVYDEDARKKREEALRAKTEEKRRKREEKELKNKLAREAKEKQDMEKRMKAEQEREEKARLALLMQERQREEAEKRRMIQQQRAQEKEERRRQEEQLRAQRLREQEEAERQLAEQRRREQEAEKRRLIEARAQQQAAAEATRLKAQYLVAQAKEKQQQAMNSKKPEPTNYVIDTDPSDAETDDESRPKHEIPFWAKSNVRRQHLAMQKYAPIDAVHKFFGSRKCTPDLRELFVGIDTSSLKRTSSAIWKTPPRFSMMEDE